MSQLNPDIKIKSEREQELEKFFRAEYYSEEYIGLRAPEKFKKIKQTATYKRRGYTEAEWKQWLGKQDVVHRQKKKAKKSDDVLHTIYAMPHS